jgi:hypothetical protein
MLISMFSEGQCLQTNPNCNQVKNWVFGDSVWLHFSDTGIVQKLIPLSNYEASSSISNNNDELIYYQTASEIFNKYGKLITKTKGGNSSTQGSYIFKHYLDTSLVLSLTNDEGNPNLNMNLYFHSFIDSGQFLFKNRILLKNTPEGLGLILHKNKNDIWIASHSINSDSFYLFLIKKNANVICPIIQKKGGDFSNGKITKWYNGGAINFSNDGSTMVSFGCESNLSGNERVDLFRFNNETGQLTDNIIINEISPTHAEFSSNSKFLYLTSNQLVQYSIQEFNKAQISNSRFVITPNSNNAIGKIQQTIDGKILVAYFDSLYLGIINSPNELGMKAQYQENGIRLNIGISKRGLPNFNASYFYTPSIDFAYIEDCWEHRYSFEGRDTIKANSWKWFFRKNNFIDSILTKNCEYQFLDTGLWQVSHIATNSNRTDTVTKTITIHSKWQKDILGNDTFYCQGIKPKFMLKSPPNMHCVHWNREEPNLDEDRGPIIDYNHFHMDSLVIDTAGIYYVKITNKTFCENWR